MTPQITIVAMLAVTLGAALYVAWPLLFGRVRPEQYLDPEYLEPVLARGDGYPNAPAKPQRRAAVADDAMDLDLEEEIEAFRRKHRATASSSSLSCTSCGRPVKDPEAAFCSKCGAPVDGGSSGSRGKRASKSREAR